MKKLQVYFIILLCFLLFSNIVNAQQGSNTCGNDIFITLPEIVTEGDGTLKGGGYVSIKSAINSNINITLSSSDASEITVPSSVTIPAGQTSASFDINVIDDGIYDRTQSVNIAFVNPGCSQKNGQILVFDNETTSLIVEVPEITFEGDGVLTAQGRISTGAIMGTDLTVSLSSNNTNIVTVPTSIVFKKGQTSAVFDINIIDNTTVNDGPYEVKIAAVASGYNSGADTIIVIDNDNLSWMNETLSKNLTYILRDDIRDRIYLGDTGNKQLVVIDSQSLKIIFRLPLNTNFIYDMAISKDNNTMAIAGGTLSLVDLETLESKQLSTDLDVVSVAFDLNGDLMLLTSENSGLVHHYHVNSESVINKFGPNNVIYKYSLLKTDKDGDMLYVAERGISPASIYKLDISGETPVLLAEDDRDIGSSLQDFAISPLKDEIYVATSPRIKVVDSNTIDFIQLLDSDQLLNTEAAGGVVVTDLGGYYVYGSGISGTPDNNVLCQFDASKRELNLKYNLIKEGDDASFRNRGIAIDRSGHRAFIIHTGDYSYNNYYSKVQVVELSVPLKISTPDSAKEGDGVLINQGVITVLQPPSEDLVISLESNDTTEVLVPATVIIPAGETTAKFDITIMDDGLRDGTQSVSIIGNIQGTFLTTSTLQVNDNETSVLHIILPDTVSEGDGFLAGQGLVSVSSPVDTDVKVRLISSDETEISVPYAVIIKAGHTSETFSFTVNEDLLIDGPQSTTISASVKGWTTGVDTIETQDNDDFLTVDVVPYVKEGDGILSGAGRVSIIEALGYDLVVHLSSSDTTEVVVPDTIKITAGNTSASFLLSIIDDNISDGTQPLTITATAANFTSDIENTSVIDNENESKLPSWSMYQGNPSHTGYMPVTLASFFTKKWVKNFYPLTPNPVTAADGRVFVSTIASYQINRLMTLKAENGEIVWEMDYDNISSPSSPLNPPSYNHGIVYIQTVKGSGSTGNFLRAFNAATGVELYKSGYSSQNYKHYSPTIYDDKVYINGGFFGGAYAFDGITGSELWYNSWLPQYDEWTPAVNEKYVFAYTSKLDVINRQTGFTEFSIPDPNFVDLNHGSMKLAPVIGDENDIIVIQFGRLISFDIAGRKIKWEIKANFSGQPSLANGSIYAISSGALSVRNESDGSLLWSWSPPAGSLTNNIIVTDSHIFTSTDSLTYVIDKNTKKLVWSYHAGGHLTLSEGALYIAGAGKLISINVFGDIDSDMDGIDDVVEALHCTSLNDIDTDDDGIPDGVEDKNHNGEVDQGESNPCQDDSDGDGLSDGVEDTNHNGIVDTGDTDPTKADTDNDGMPDGWEVQYDLDPLVNDAKEDADGDHFSNIKEYLKNTDPTDDKSHPPRSMPWLPLLLGE